MAGSLNQWAPAIAGAALGLALLIFALISTRRLDARIRREREKAAAGARPGK